MRFGINSGVLDATTIRPATGSLIQKLPDVAPSTKGGSGTASSPGVDVATHKAEAQKQVTQYEIDVVTKAIAHLNATGQTAKTALVDIFERDTGGNIAAAKDASGTIIMTASGRPKPATHTVVLFAQEVKCQGVNQGTKYLVIDPSNASFSHILAGASDDIRLCFSKKCQIYTPKDKTMVGPGPDKWRDCIDIAVKLAFNIEVNTRLGMFQVAVKEDATTNSGEIEFVSLRDSAPVKEVTNQKDVYKKLPDEVSTHPMRLKQSSDVKVEKKVTAALKILDKTSTDLRKTLEALDLYHAFSALEQKIKDFYSASDAVIQYNDFERECITFLKNIDQAVGSSEATALLGLEWNAIDQLP